MKLYYPILLLFIFSAGCAGSNIALNGNQMNSMKPLMERTADEDKINIAIPVYKF